MKLRGKTKMWWVIVLTLLITFETYIYWSGDIGKKFSEGLCERSRVGVKVRVMLDWVGCGKLETKYLEGMKAAGVEGEFYHPLRWYNLGRMNNRIHRKLLVVDGRIGFVTPDNRALGTLCVIDKVVRTVTVAQKKDLLALSRLKMTELELRRSLREEGRTRTPRHSRRAVR